HPPEPARAAEPLTPPKPSGAPDDVNSSGTPAVTNSVPPRRPLVSAKLRGIAVDGTGADGNPVREICPGQRVAPCPGVELVGDIPPPLVSTATRIVPVIVQGKYDGATLLV